ncbi:MAG: lysophospholipid acyltransferase family protein [Lachnospiraceae bacterium]
MIRLILVVLFIVLFLILSTPLLAFEWFYHKKHPEKADIQSLHIVQWAFRGILLLSGVHYEVKGLEKIPKDKAVVYVANHKSLFDTVLVYSLMPGPTGFVAKDSMLKVPLLRIWMRRLHCQFLDREDPRAGLQMILDCIELIKKGISIFIFPEGTRIAEDEMQPFKPGAVKMASKTGCPLIPVAIKGTRDVLENHFPLIRSAVVTVTIGDPIIPGELDEENKKHLAVYAQNKVQELLDQE